MASNGTVHPPSGAWGLYLITEESRSSTYGIGTYLKQVVEAMRDSEWQVTIIVLRSTKTSTLLEEEIDGVRHLYIGISKEMGILGRPKIMRRYYKRALLLLQRYIEKENERSIFHLQKMHMADLAIGLKALYPQSKIVGTVHYMDWSFVLLGQKEKLKEILAQPDTEDGKFYTESIAEEKHFLNACDSVIAIAGHSYNTLRELYQIPEHMLTLIPNGLKDQYIPLCNTERETIRDYYGFKRNDIILIFAGRIDPVKGADLLAEAFASLITVYPNLRLIIAGDGNTSSIQEKIKPHWSKVTLTGFVDKTTLYKLYSIADIGVLPSLHEEFGYVALEMMMMGLPLVVSKTTGLEEIVVDGKTGYVVPFFKESERVNGLRNAIEQLLLTRSSLWQPFGANGRERFVSQYETNVFKHKMRGLFYSLVSD